ncbi:MAG: protein kinase domain-containing protein [Gaiellaceae bacterium]
MRILGRGGMAIVCLAEDVRLKRNVALKLVRPHLAQEPSFRARFLRESEIAASLDHPNIVPIYAAGEADGRLFIAMRYVEGPNLRQLLRVGPLPPAEAVWLTEQIASALDAAHVRGLVHGDVKPSNALIAPGAGRGGRDHVYLTDFGLSRQLSEERSGAAHDRLMGTVDYIAPEQIEGNNVDHRVDIYALGCLLYESLTGLPPFQRKSAAATLFAHMREDPPRASRRNPDLAVAIDTVVARALAKSADERYQTCGELVDAARSALGVKDVGLARRPRLHSLLAIVATLGIIFIAAFFVLRGQHGDKRGAAPERGDGLASVASKRLAQLGGASLVGIDPSTNKVTAVADAPPDAVALAVADDAIWVAGDRSGLLPLDPKTTHRLRSSLLIEDNASGVATARGTVAVAIGGRRRAIEFFNGNCVCRIQLKQGRSSMSPVPRVTSDKRSIWIADPLGAFIARLDPARRKLVDLVPVRTLVGGHLARLYGLAVGEGGLWAIGGYSYDVARGSGVIESVQVASYLWHIDPLAHKVVATIPLPTRPHWQLFEPPARPDSVATGAGSVWITAAGGGVLWRVDPTTNKLTATIPAGGGASGVAVGFGSVWVADAMSGTVNKIDPHTNRLIDSIDVGDDPQQVAVGFGRVWVDHWDIRPVTPQEPSLH